MVHRNAVPVAVPTAGGYCGTLESFPCTGNPEKGGGVEVVSGDVLFCEHP